ncbi:unnamed protein product [Porites evermanni]|uniref:Reverse transcriptase n=1 Tax=Porites evermanni TaxID=104178 RepID=A0ABN8PFW9_9CNID|nr:unnamed protein product [Porites evermanni]
MANATGNICSGPKRPRPSDSSDPEPNPVYSSPSSLDSTIETVLRKAVRMRVDADKAHSSLIGRIKLLEEHAAQGTSPSGLRIKKVQAKGQNVEALQAKFDGIIREAEVQLLEATIDHLRSEVKDHQEAIRATTANIDGTIARWKEQLLKNDISNAKATSLVEAAVAFVEKLSKDTAVSQASKALQAEITRTAKNRSQAMMDDSEVFVASEESIRDIIRNELRGLTSGTTSPNEENRQRKVSISERRNNGKSKGKSRRSRSTSRGQAQQRQRSTSAKRSNRPQKVLGMGLKFRPSLLPPSEAQFDLQIQDFCRRVRLQDKFANCPPDKDFNPRLYVPTGWNPPRENPDLEDKLFALRKELLKNIVAGKPHWKNNLTKHEREELSELKSNPNIKILPTDKNLGPALVSTDWVQAETLRHLHDELSYHKVTQQDWYANRLNVINSREKLMTIYSRFISSSVARFLRSFDHFVSPAKFYVIPKIHKNPMVGRPIAASHSFITRPISTFVDELIKPKVHMPTVLRDSGELIQLLENTTAFNCSHARIRNVINRIMPEIDCTVCYKATVTLANLCK